jgi:hypothetical protein
MHKPYPHLVVLQGTARMGATNLLESWIVGSEWQFESNIYFLIGMLLLALTLDLGQSAFLPYLVFYAFTQEQIPFSTAIRPLPF